METLTNNKLYFLLVLMISFSCTSERLESNKILKDLTNYDSIYLLKDNQLSFICSNPHIKKSGVIYPTMCQIIIEKFDENKYYTEIINTKESKWIELLSSDSPKLASSISKWLYFLSKQKVDMADLVTLDLWNETIKDKQIKFWKLYLKENELLIKPK